MAMGNRGTVNRTARGTMFLLSFTLLTTACRQDESVGPQRPRPSLSSEGKDHPITLDQKFEELAKEIPGFAGLGFNEQHQLVVHLASAGSREQAVQPLVAFLEASNRGNAEELVAGMVITPANYDFAQLADWRRQLLRANPPKGITKSDVDERNNIVYITGENASVAGHLRSLARELKIPDNAIRVEIEPPIVPDALLTDTYRPLIGSLQMTTVGTGSCTIWGLALTATGLQVDSTDVYVVTNSHCTDDVDSSTGQAWCQNNCLFHQGNEVADPARWVYPNDPYLWSNSTCLSGYYCRYSDAALLKIDSSVVWHGTMGVTCSGITLCDTYTIKDAVWPFYGDVTYTVGAASGFQGGYVQNTCVDRLQSGSYYVTDLLCQYEADYHSQSGDSGKMVVTPCPTCQGYNPVYALGINWGHNSSYGLFSSAIMASAELASAMGKGWLMISR